MPPEAMGGKSERRGWEDGKEKTGGGSPGRRNSRRKVRGKRVEESKEDMDGGR